MDRLRMRGGRDCPEVRRDGDDLGSSKLPLVETMEIVLHDVGKLLIE